MILKGRKRTDDIATDLSITFEDLHLSKNVSSGLHAGRFQIPSPIQLRAISIAKSGLDLIAQAKVGTGKTLAFVIPILEIIQTSLLSPQALVLAPTREIALQIHSVFKAIGKFIPNLRVNAFIGGLSISNDIQKLSPCHIVVGSPGRIYQLYSEGLLHLKNIRILVIDEVDRIWSIPKIFNIVDILLKELSSVQFLAFCATLPTEILEALQKKMKSPQIIRLEPQMLSIKGIHQYYQIVDYTIKVDRVCEILSQIAFHQCLIFCNNSLKAEKLVDRLNEEGWPCARIAGYFNQKKRIEIMKKIREFHLRVLISTDLISRGVDIERINLVINVDISPNPEIHLHRIGRTGRFGTYGVAINLVTEDEFQILKENVKTFNCELEELPKSIPPDFYYYEIQNEKENLKLKRLIEIREKTKKELEIRQIKSLKSKKKRNPIRNSSINKKYTKNSGFTSITNMRSQNEYWTINHYDPWQIGASFHNKNYSNEAKKFKSDKSLNTEDIYGKYYHFNSLGHFFESLDSDYPAPPPPIMASQDIHEQYINYISSIYLPNLRKKYSE